MAVTTETVAAPSMPVEDATAPDVVAPDNAGQEAMALETAPSETTPPEMPKPGRTPRPFTASDLDAVVDDGYRREIIEGRLIVTPSPIFEHQNVVFELGYRMRSEHPPGFKVAMAPLDWRPPTGESLQPDVMVIREEDYNPKGFMLGTPLLVVEVRSPSTAVYDETTKRARYESLGVIDYWMVDPATPSIVALHLADGHYVEVGRATGDESFQATTPFPVTVVPSELIA